MTRPSRLTRRHVLALWPALTPPAWAQPAGAPTTPFDGRWRLISPPGKGDEGLRIEGGKLQFTDRHGQPSGLAMAYRVQGRRLEAERLPNAQAQLVLTLGADGRLSGDAAGMGTMVLARVSPPPPAPAAPTGHPPVASGTVAPVRGRYLQEGMPEGGFDFREGQVRFISLGREQGALPFVQQGAKIVIVGPHAEETLWVMQDGRLRLGRDHLAWVYFRRQGG